MSFYYQDAKLRQQITFKNDEDHILSNSNNGDLPYNMIIMGNTTEDTELQTELQEVYMQATHWLHDISFLKTETHFFRNIINRYQTSAGDGSHTGMFEAKITGQEQSLAALLAKIPVFLEFLKPYVEDREKEINLDFLTRYNNLKDELDALFNSIRTTKNELFKYTESIMPSLNSSKAN